MGSGYVKSLVTGTISDAIKGTLSDYIGDMHGGDQQKLSGILNAIWNSQSDDTKNKFGGSITKFKQYLANKYNNGSTDASSLLSKLVSVYGNLKGGSCVSFDLTELLNMPSLGLDTSWLTSQTSATVAEQKKSYIQTVLVSSAPQVVDFRLKNNNVDGATSETNEVYLSWTWNRSQTKGFKVKWEYWDGSTRTVKSSSGGGGKTTTSTSAANLTVNSYPNYNGNGYYRIRLSWGNPRSQIAAYTNWGNAFRMWQTKASAGYHIYDNNGKALDVVTKTTTISTPSSAKYTTEKLWYTGTESSISYSDVGYALYSSTYTVPNGARRIRYTITVESETGTGQVNGVEKSIPVFKAQTKSGEMGDFKYKVVTPPAPTVSVVNGTTVRVVCNLESTKTKAQYICFELYKNKSEKSGVSSWLPIPSISKEVTYDFKGTFNSKYSARCQTYYSNENAYSEWSTFSSEVETIPSPPTITRISAYNTHTENTYAIKIEWNKQSNVDGYTIQYSKDKNNLINEVESAVQTVNADKNDTFKIITLDSGGQYFARIKSQNGTGESGWSNIVTITIGEKPAAPTTWSSAAAMIEGEDCNLYFVHNSVDGSTWRSADIQFKYAIGDSDNYTTYTFTRSNGFKYNWVTLENTSREDLEYERNKTGVWPMSHNNTFANTTGFSSLLAFIAKQLNNNNYVKLKWSVRTRGIYSGGANAGASDWSVERILMYYSKPDLDLSIHKVDGSTITDGIIDVVDTYPFFVKMDINKNKVISTHVSVISNEQNEVYVDTDEVGNRMVVNPGDQLFSRSYKFYPDYNGVSGILFTPGDVNLSNNKYYSIYVTICEDSGLTTTTSVVFKLEEGETGNWIPSATVIINDDELSATIGVCAIRRGPAMTEDGEFDTDENGNIMPAEEVCDDILLDLYRLNFDGTYTKINESSSTGLTYYTDPHPTLNAARYRVVGTSMTNGISTYADIPEVPINNPSLVIQWNDNHVSYEIDSSTNEISIESSNKILRLPFNLDVSESNTLDVEHNSYIGREHPVSYYGTQVGQKMSCSVDIDATDYETLSLLRQLAILKSDVYVREPSGIGYWASVVVTMSQTHCNVVIPVSLEITRVDGGV